MSVQVLQGDCIKVMRALKDNSVDSVVTDPPAGISFMSKSWDADHGGRRQWVAWLTECMTEALRVLKPGGHALVWSLPRTSHWTAWALEDAGFEVRDCIMHIFGTGFPKSLDVSRAIDKAAGAEREIIGAGRYSNRGRRTDNEVYGTATPSIQEKETAPATDAAKQWEGFGTALKPSHEMWWLCRKPLTEKTVAGNVQEWGTGGINIDGCKVGTTRDVPASLSKNKTPNDIFGEYGGGASKELDSNTGRWPPNILLTHPDCEDGCEEDCPVAEMDAQSGISKSPKVYKYSGKPETERSAYGKGLGYGMHEGEYGDSGGASRFFPVFRYQAKAKTSERPKVDGINHPTVKPLELMKWLARLITPPGGICLDMFAGTGPTGEACLDEGFNCILIEREPDYIKLIRKRLGSREPSLFDML